MPSGSTANISITNGAGWAGPVSQCPGEAAAPPARPTPAQPTRRSALTCSSTESSSAGCLRDTTKNTSHVEHRPSDRVPHNAPCGDQLPDPRPNGRHPHLAPDVRGLSASSGCRELLSGRGTLLRNPSKGRDRPVRNRLRPGAGSDGLGHSGGDSRPAAKRNSESRTRESSCSGGCSGSKWRWLRTAGSR